MNSYYNDYQDMDDEREYSEDEFQEAYRKEAENNFGYDLDEEMFINR